MKQSTVSHVETDRWMKKQEGEKDRLQSCELNSERVRMCHYYTISLTVYFKIGQVKILSYLLKTYSDLKKYFQGPGYFFFNKYANIDFLPLGVRAAHCKNTEKLLLQIFEAEGTSRVAWLFSVILL